MPTIPVRFQFVTGLKRSIFSNVRLVGSWDEQGLFSNTWTTAPMTAMLGDDGCPTFEAVMQFDASQMNGMFQWGAVLDGPAGNDQWGIMVEVKDVNSTARVRSFTLKDAGVGPTQTEVYYFTQCRRLGAQKVQGPAGSELIRFGVWAPDALNVGVVFGFTWDANDPSQLPATQPLPVTRIMGGYVSDQGVGVRTDLDPLTMRKSAEGIWLTDALGPYSKFDHLPYMFKVTKDDNNVVYRTDIYSRSQIGAGSNNPGGTAFTGKLHDLNSAVSCSAVINPDTVTKFFKETVTVAGKEVALYPETEFFDESDFWSQAQYTVGGKTLVAANEFDPNRQVPQRVEDLVIYELHLGSLGFGKTRPGNIDDALVLLDYLTDPANGLGTNAIELLPLEEFGDKAAGWGYGPLHFFALEYGGNGRDKFKFFIKACHQRGVAVIMDVVYNHYNTANTERAEELFDSDDPESNVYFWYESPANGQPGTYVQNGSTGRAPRYHEEQVRQLFASSAVTLMEEFHIDGFRADQTTSIHAYNVREDNGSIAVPSANIFGIKMLRQWSRTLRMIKPQIMLMAEDYSGWDKVTQPPDNDGLGFDATWYADYHHNLVGENYGSDYAKLIPSAGFGNDMPLAMDYFAGALGASGTQKVVFHVSHDEAGNAGVDNPPGFDNHTHRTLVVAVRGDPAVSITGLTRKYAEARCRFAFGVTVFSAGTPMFLFGEEVGFQKDFIDKDELILQNREDLFGDRANPDRGQRLFQFWRDAILLRRNQATLQSRNISILHVHNANRVLVFKRWDASGEFIVLASLNNTPFNNPGYIVNHPDIWGGSQWHEIFNSDASIYNGDNVGNDGATLTAQPGSLQAVIPANGVVVLQRV
jgi:1,4-alpha-glucan branching enzyme